MGGWQEENGCIDPGRVGPGGNLVNDTDGYQMSNHSAHSGDWETAKSTTDWIREVSKDKTVPWFAFQGMNIVHPPCESRAARIDEKAAASRRCRRDMAASDARRRRDQSALEHCPQHSRPRSAQPRTPLLSPGRPARIGARTAKTSHMHVPRGLTSGEGVPSKPPRVRVTALTAGSQHISRLPASGG